MGEESIPFSDGSGYFFGMDVFHQLHCLDYIRRKSIMYHHLYPSTAEEEDVPPQYHIRMLSCHLLHCIVG